MYKPSFEEAIKIKNNFDLIPISKEVEADMLTPIRVMRILKSVSKHCFLLESVEDVKQWGRYTFLGLEPKLEISCVDGEVTVIGNNEKKVIKSNPSDYIKDLMKTHRSATFDYLPTFTGGLMGYFSYDYIKYSEPSLVLKAHDDENFKDMDLMLFDKIIAFDNLRQKIQIIVNVSCDNIETEYEKATKELDRLEEIINSEISEENISGKLTSDINSLFSCDEYCKMVEKAKEYIKEGDIFQVVLSNRFDAEFEGSLFNTYRILRSTNPSPYMFYMSSNNIEIVGASPETLVKLENGVLHTFPLAGTRPRGKTKEKDLALEKELLADEKELSEHNMLVDLGRNDLGKISKFGTVEVENYMSVLRFSHVMHIGSTVVGEICDDKDAVDAISAVLPAGTLSGAPKIRACEIIDELENNKRGIYGGAIGYIDFKGNMDTCISIRLAFAKNGRVFVRSGAGIVADSVPAKEYEECINKAKAVIEALKKSSRGDKK